MKDSDKQHEEAVKSYEAFMKRHPTPYIACLHSKLQRARREIEELQKEPRTLDIFEESCPNCISVYYQEFSCGQHGTYSLTKTK